jgi:hypothetical protein
MPEPSHVWQHPWLRIQLLLRAMLGSRWDATTWPAIKAELKKALEMRSLMVADGGGVFDLPTELQIGDRFTDEKCAWPVIRSGFG